MKKIYTILLTFMIIGISPAFAQEETDTITEEALMDIEFQDKVNKEMQAAETAVQKAEEAALRAEAASKAANEARAAAEEAKENAEKQREKARKEEEKDRNSKKDRASKQKKKEKNKEIEEPEEAQSRKKKDRFTNNPDADRIVNIEKLEVGDIVTTTEAKIMSKGEHMAIVVKIPEAEVKHVQKSWKKLIKNKTKSKVQETGDEIWISSTLLKDIHQEAIGVYGKLIQTEKGVTVYAFFEIFGEFITESDADKISTSKQFLRKFAVSEYKAAVWNQLKGEEKNLKGLKHNLSKLQRENEKLHKSIQTNESNISNTESAIEVNLSDQDRTAEQIKDRKENVYQVKGNEELEKTAKKELKDTEKTLKKLQKKNQTMHKNIAKYKSNIDTARREIQLNLDQQSIENEAIKKQMGMVRSVKNKLGNIK